MSNKYIIEKSNSSQTADTVWFPKTTKDLLTDAQGHKVTDLSTEDDITNEKNSATPDKLKTGLKNKANQLITKEVLKNYLTSNFISKATSETLFTNTVQENIEAGIGFKLNSKVLQADTDALDISPVFLTNFKLNVKNPNISSSGTLKLETNKYVSQQENTWADWLAEQQQVFKFENGMTGTISNVIVSNVHRVQISIPNKSSSSTTAFTYNLYKQDSTSNTSTLVNAEDVIKENTYFEFK